MTDTFITVETYLGTAYLRPEAITAVLMDNLDHVGQIHCGNSTFTCTWENTEALLRTLTIEDSSKTTIRLITGASGYSKSHSKGYSFWRCQLTNGGILNIHDHPDPKRNKFNVVKAAGWDDVFPDADIEAEVYIPVRVKVNDEGWWELVEMEARNAETEGGSHD